MASFVSIIINTYNRARSLAATLESLAWLRHPRFEVIVVNGPSTDATEEVMARFAGKIRVASCPEANLAVSRNIGLAMAAGDIIAYTDDDAIPEPDWLDALCAAYVDSAVGAVGGFIRDHTGYCFQCKVVACDRFGDNEGFGTVRQALAAGVSDRGPGAARFLSPTGANSSFRRRALEEIGGFDEEFAYFLDETDVAVRLIDRGWTLAYAPYAEVHHRCAESHLRSADRLPRSIYLPARSKAYFCIRHAVPQLGIRPVVDHLTRYRTDRRRDQEWLSDRRLIGRERHHRLADEIDRGSADGVADAFRFPGGRVSTRARSEESPRPFPVARPAQARLRLCFLSQDYPPGPVGGIAVWTHTLAASLAARGHEVSVVTRGRGHPRVSFEQGVWVHRIPPVSQRGRREPALPNLPPDIAEWAYTAFDEVQRIRARRGLHLVSAPIWDVEGIACASDGTLPVQTSLHTTCKLMLPFKPHWNEGATARRLRVDKVIAAERWLLEVSEVVLANSRAIVDGIEEAYGVRLLPSRLALVPHGLVPSESAPVRKASGDCRILFVGRFEMRKGIDLLVAAVPEVLRGASQARFVFVGDTEADDGPVHRRALEALPMELRVRVEIKGLVSRAVLDEEYRRADVFVAPSRFESFGLVFLEAMMQGVACIGAAAGGIPEVVTDGETGLLVPPGDVPALAAALLRLAQDRALRARLGAAGLARFEAEFTAARMAEAAEAEYARITRREHILAYVPPRTGDADQGPSARRARDRRAGSAGRRSPALWPRRMSGPT